MQRRPSRALTCGPSAHRSCQRPPPPLARVAGSTRVFGDVADFNAQVADAAHVKKLMGLPVVRPYPGEAWPIYPFNDIRVRSSGNKRSSATDRPRAQPLVLASPGRSRLGWGCRPVPRLHPRLHPGAGRPPAEADLQRHFRVTAFRPPNGTHPERTGLIRRQQRRQHPCWSIKKSCRPYGLDQP